MRLTSLPQSSVAIENPIPEPYAPGGPEGPGRALSKGPAPIEAPLGPLQSSISETYAPRNPNSPPVGPYPRAIRPKVPYI